jgi:hypothetical protein
VSLIAARLVASAENRLTCLSSAPDRPGWASQLGILTSAAHGLDTIRTTWDETLDGLPPNAGPGDPAHDTAMAERDAAAWPLLELWALHGQTVLDIRTAAAGPSRPRLQSTAPVPPVTSTSRAPAARR